MKKLALAGAALCLCLLVAAPGYAAGRLNFMLNNLTGQEITGVKICPTYFPQYLSDNLLKAPLPADSRIYIGPDYYGEQRNWDIKLTWANGHEQTFPNLLLTRYNSYTAYNTPSGVHLRQSYEPALAKAEAFVPSYEMGKSGELTIAVGAPEKVTVIDQTDKNKATGPSSFVFEEGEKGAPILKESLGAKIQGNPTALKTSVEVNREGKTAREQPGTQLKNGDNIQLKYIASNDGYVYWLAKSPEGQYLLIFPTNGADNKVSRNKEYTVPQEKPINLDKKEGAEAVTVILTPKPEPRLEKAASLSTSGKQQEASAAFEEIITENAKKREAGEIFFEEEVVGPATIRSQTSPSDDAFVEEYELIYNQK